MKKINTNWFFVFIVLFIIVVGLITVFFSDEGFTGESVKHANTYIGCRYLYHDKFGECYRVERQESNHCDDKDGTLLPDVAVHNRLWNRRTTAWFYRPCSNDGTSRG